LNQSTRQRVVGTVVLLLAAVVVLPAVLDGDGVPSRDIENRIPARPADPEPLDVTPQRPVITADTEDLRVLDDSPAINAGDAGKSDRDTPDERAALDAGPVDGTAAGAASAADTPALDPATGLPRAWSVQLGAFSNPANVETLVGRLREAGHPAYTRVIESSSGGLTGVYVGPLVDRSTAVSLQKELQSAFQLTGRVIRYRIEE